MRKVFQSYNGLIFEDEEECVEYERAHPAFTMYDSYGETNEPNVASLVVIKDESGAESWFVENAATGERTAVKGCFHSFKHGTKGSCKETDKRN